MPQISEGRRAEDFFALKNPTASAGFEPANLGTKGQHATSRPPKPRLSKLIMEWIPGESRKRGRPSKMWMEGLQAAMKARHLEANQCLNRKE
jgi:hypothetical protein